MASYPYRVTFKVDSTTFVRTLNLYGGSESEAIDVLYKQCTVPRSKPIIILCIERV